MTSSNSSSSALSRRAAGSSTTSLARRRLLFVGFGSGALLVLGATQASAHTLGGRRARGTSSQRPCRTSPGTRPPAGPSTSESSTANVTSAASGSTASGSTASGSTVSGSTVSGSTVSGSTASGSTAGLTANALAVRTAVLERFPQITTVGGVRADSLPDHPSGHALDFMVPSPTSTAGRALGTAIATFLRSNASSLNVSYVIWRQHIWSVARASEGWRAMADRGGATANHMDHVHVTVN